jgi:type III pantothenate kinase
MNLVIDQGNTFTKIAVFDKSSILYETVTTMINPEEMGSLTERFSIDQAIVCSVAQFSKEVLELFQEKKIGCLILTAKTLLPIANHYQTPESLGSDRIAAAVGANFLKPDVNLLVIDMGTAVTYDVVSEKNEYLGGNISPGLTSRFRALHDYTHKLPLLQPSVRFPFVIGTSTEEGIMTGVMNGLMSEIEGMIANLEQEYAPLSVFLTGGDSIYFESSLKTPIFAVKNLVLVGLNRILIHNAY